MKPPPIVVLALALMLTVLCAAGVACIAQPSYVLSFGNPHSISEDQIRTIGWLVLAMVAVCALGCTFGLPYNNGSGQDEHLANFD